MFVLEKIFAFDEHVVYLDSLYINNTAVYIQGKNKRKKVQPDQGSKGDGKIPIDQTDWGHTISQTHHNCRTSSLRDSTGHPLRSWHESSNLKTASRAWVPWVNKPATESLAIHSAETKANPTDE